MLLYSSKINWFQHFFSIFFINLKRFKKLACRPSILRGWTWLIFINFDIFSDFLTIPPYSLKEAEQIVQKITFNVLETPSKPIFTQFMSRLEPKSESGGPKIGKLWRGKSRSKTKKNVWKLDERKWAKITHFYCPVWKKIRRWWHNFRVLTHLPTLLLKHHHPKYNHMRS